MQQKSLSRVELGALQLFWLQHLISLIYSCAYVLNRWGYCYGDTMLIEIVDRKEQVKKGSVILSFSVTISSNGKPFSLQTFPLLLNITVNERINVNTVTVG